MKILFLARRFHPQIGGVEKHVLKLSEALIKAGHTVTIVTELLGDSSRSEVFQGISIYRIPIGADDKGKKFRVWKNMWQLRKLIQEADVVHCHDVFFWYLPFRFLYPSKPVYTTFHGYEGYPIQKKAIGMRKLSERLSWGNICIGDFIPKWYGTKATYVSYGAVTLSSRPSNLSPQRKESALFFGRLDEQTGILDYGDAISLLRKKHPKFEFLVVGEGGEQKKIEKIATKFAGFQKDPEKYFAQYHFAFVSRYLSILEAFAARRLVMAVYDNSVKEDYLRLAPFAPWIVIAKDGQELATQVEYFLNHPTEEKKLIDKAYKWVQHQAWQQMVETYLNLWTKKA